MAFVCGGVIVMTWAAMAYYAFNAEWAHLLGAFIVQCLAAVLRNAFKDT